MRRRVAFSCALLAVLSACGGGAGEAATTAAPGTSTIASPTTTAATTVPAPVVQMVRFPSTGAFLQGRLFPNGTTWVLLAHMFPADMTSWFDFAAAAQRAGYTALAYNNRGYGASDPGDSLDVGADAAAALAFARASGAEAVFFFGASMNGAAALFLAAEADLAGFASLSGVPEWENTPGLDRAAEVTEPGLFVAAEDDGDAVATARLMADAVSGPAEVVVYPTGGHGTDMLGDNPSLTDLLLDFLQAHS